MTKREKQLTHLDSSLYLAVELCYSIQLKNNIYGSHSVFVLISMQIICNRMCIARESKLYLPFDLELRLHLPMDNFNIMSGWLAGWLAVWSNQSIIIFRQKSIPDDVNNEANGSIPLRFNHFELHCASNFHQ